MFGVKVGDKTGRLPAIKPSSDDDAVIPESATTNISTRPRITYKCYGRLNSPYRLKDSSENPIMVESVEKKRKKEDGKFDDQNTRIVDYTASSTDDESCSEKALRNPIILRNLFKYFSTGFLLSSCSLVNKSWNWDVRIFIRNNRRCAAKSPSKTSSCNFSTCQFVLDLGNLCRQMREEGRESPFNGLSLKFKRVGCSRESGRDAGMHMNLPREMTLQYLDITCESKKAQDHIQPSIYSLIRSHASEIQHLKASSVLLLTDPLGEQVPYFPKLKDITISKLSSYDEAEQRDILRKIQAKSPALRNIFVDGPLRPLRTDRTIYDLEIVPQELYHLLGNLTIWMEQGFEEKSQYGDIVCRKPKLRKLSISERFNADSPQAFRSSVKQLLQCGGDSLEYFYLYVGTFHILPLLSHQALKNLSKLDLEIWDDGNFDLQEAWNILASIDSDKMMPKLEDVRIYFEMAKLKPYPEWPAANNTYKGDVRPSYRNVRKLTLKPAHFACNLIEVRTVFPHITVLIYDNINPCGHVPCQELWELWPQLEELRVSGVYDMLGKNYDADFCGIHEEEAELLRDMDDQHLRNVHIVPIRPSLLTMQSLRTLRFDIEFDAGPEARTPGGPPIFISRVTELVALERLTYKEAAISCAMLSDGGSQLYNEHKDDGGSDSDDSGDDSSGGSGYDSSDSDDYGVDSDSDGSGDYISESEDNSDE